LAECTALIAACKQHFAAPAITEVEWKPGKKSGKDKKGQEAEEDTETNKDAAEIDDEESSS